MILGNIFAVKRKGLSSFISFMATFFFKKKKPRGAKTGRKLKPFRMFNTIVIGDY
jgi:hypothetical protein